MSFLLSILAAAAPAVPSPIQAVREGDAYVLRTLNGAMPLYTYDRDEPGKSNCNDRCAAAWPPLVASASAKPIGKWSIITRIDRRSQWALDGRPVYTFVRDTPGTATGDGMGGTWHLLPTTPAQ